jgi:hypothetical protein
MSIVYGIYFFTVTKSNDSKKFKLFEVKKFMNTKAKVHGNQLTLICNNDSELCYLLDAKKNIVEEFDLDEKVKTYILKKDELLEPTRHRNIELSNNLYFEPSIIFKRFKNGLFETLIYYTTNDKWVYVSPYFDDTKEFINKEDIISYIKKRDYLPMYSGLAQ